MTEAQAKALVNGVNVKLPFLTILFFIFLVAKLAGWITWSWWWVTAPLWGPYALIFGIIAIVFAFALVVLFIEAIVDAAKSKKRF